jgi:hypothetical protein
MFRFGGVAAGTSTSAHNKCSVGRLEGTFGYNTDGLVLFTTPPTGPPFDPIKDYVPFALTGAITFDGKGNLNSFDFANLGSGAYPRTGTGTYAVDATAAAAGYCGFDVIWTLTTPGVPTTTLNLYVVLARQGTVLKLLNTDPGIVVACSWDKVETQ